MKALENKLDNKLRVLKKLLKEKKVFIATAESCTGGLLGSLLTKSSGASEIYLGGVVTYHNDAKLTLLGVREDTLKRYGAVSKQTSIEMSRGLIKKLKKSKITNIIAVSITGIAGPGGGTVKKPLGTVYITVTLNSVDYTKKFSFKGPRDKIRRSSCLEGVTMAINVLNETE